MAFTLPQLPYAFDALEPHIDATTMQIHHGKHHAAYVKNLNDALDKHPDLKDKSVEDLLKSLSSIPEDIRAAVRKTAAATSITRCSGKSWVRKKAASRTAPLAMRSKARSDRSTRSRSR